MASSWPQSPSLSYAASASHSSNFEVQLCKKNFSFHSAWGYERHLSLLPPHHSCLCYNISLIPSAVLPSDSHLVPTHQHLNVLGLSWQKSRAATLCISVRFSLCYSLPALTTPTLNCTCEWEGSWLEKKIWPSIFQHFLHALQWHFQKSLPQRWGQEEDLHTRRLDQCSLNSTR